MKVDTVIIYFLLHPKIIAGLFSMKGEKRKVFVACETFVMVLTVQRKWLLKFTYPQTKKFNAL